jgi:hypothetical protein
MLIYDGCCCLKSGWGREKLERQRESMYTYGNLESTGGETERKYFAVGIHAFPHTFSLYGNQPFCFALRVAYFTKCVLVRKI